MNTIVAAILEDDRPRVKELLDADNARNPPCEPCHAVNSKIFHWIYVGDTALYLAAAGYRVEIAGLLLNAGANPNSAMNHRHGSPLHYAADGYIDGPAWDAKRQAKTLRCLLQAWVASNAQDKNRATPLHCAVRTRCAVVQYDAFCMQAVIRFCKTNRGQRRFTSQCKTPYRRRIWSGKGQNLRQRQIIKELLAIEAEHVLSKTVEASQSS